MKFEVASVITLFVLFALSFCSFGCGSPDNIYQITLVSQNDGGAQESSTEEPDVVSEGSSEASEDSKAEEPSPDVAFDVPPELETSVPESTVCECERGGCGVDNVCVCQRQKAIDNWCKDSYVAFVGATCAFPDCSHFGANIYCCPIK